MPKSKKLLCMFGIYGATISVVAFAGSVEATAFVAFIMILPFILMIFALEEFDE